MALEVLLVMYKIREPSAKMAILLIHKTKTGDSITTSFRVYIRVIPRDFPTCIQLVKNVNLSVPDSFTLRRP